MPEFRKAVLSVDISLIRSFAIPFFCLPEVLLHPLALVIAQTEIVLSIGIPCFCRLPKTTECSSVILIIVMAQPPADQTLRLCSEERGIRFRLYLQGTNNG